MEAFAGSKGSAALQADGQMIARRMDAKESWCQGSVLRGTPAGGWPARVSQECGCAARRAPRQRIAALPLVGMPGACGLNAHTVCEGAARAAKCHRAHGRIVIASAPAVAPPKQALSRQGSRPMGHTSNCSNVIKWQRARNREAAGARRGRQRAARARQSRDGRSFARARPSPRRPGLAQPVNPRLNRASNTKDRDIPIRP